MFQPINQEIWERREHYAYYTKTLPCGYSVTVRLDVTNLYEEVKRHGLKFYPAFIYCASKAVNEMKEFRMGKDAEGNPGIWDVVHPNYTIFHEDDHTFSDIWSYYDEDFSICYENITADMERYKDCKGTWVPGGEPNLFPIITFGKYTESEGRKKLSAALTIGHAAADGYHVSQLFKRLQEILSDIQF